VSISDKELEKLVNKQLGEFYKARLEKVQGLELKKALSRKNPYLFRAIGTENASQIVEYLLYAILSSSDETIFGNTFFEPVAKEVAKIVFNGVVAPASGIDFTIETNVKYSAYGMKSGENWGNSSQKSQLKTDFGKSQKILYKIQKQFDPVVGHGYGTKNTSFNPKTGWRDVSGQAFWKEISGDANFYLKIIQLMKDFPQKHRTEFQKSWDALVNKFTSEFISDFCNSDGSIDWDKLTKFVSEEDKNTRKELMEKNRGKKKHGKQ
jgi:hypothetical protein